MSKTFQGIQVTGKIDRFNFQLCRKDFSIVTKALMGILDDGVGPDGINCRERARELGMMMWQKRLDLAKDEVATAEAVIGDNNG